MYAVFRYSTGRILSYFTDERSAQLYCDDQNDQDTQFLKDFPISSDARTPAPDWGYKLMTVGASVDELCEGLNS